MIKNRSQQGVTLVEMMIAMVVSLVLVAGIGTIYFSSKRNYQARDQFAMMDENARIALNALKKNLEHAGYASNGLFPLAHPFVVGSQPVWAACADGASNNHSNVNMYLTQDGAVPTPPANAQDDGVGIAFLSDNSLFTDCGNAEIPAACRSGQAPSSQASLVYNTFTLDQPSTTERNAAGDVIPALYCSGSASSTRQMIAQGIENIQIMYGVDANADGTVEQYKTATNVNAASQWPNVISIKISLLVKSLEPVLQAAETHTYTLLDNVITTNDRYQRNVYTEVIHLRNRV